LMTFDYTVTRCDFANGDSAWLNYGESGEPHGWNAAPWDVPF
jgi:hypothetical protein